MYFPCLESALPHGTTHMYLNPAVHFQICWSKLKKCILNENEFIHLYFTIYTAMRTIVQIRKQMSFGTHEKSILGCGLGWTVKKKVSADFEQLLRPLFFHFFGVKKSKKTHFLGQTI